MTSELPATAQRDALKTDITTTRAELRRTLAAIAAKTQVKARAKQAAKENLIGAKERVSTRVSGVQTEVAAWGQRLRTLPARQRLSVAAVLAGAMSVATATFGFRSLSTSRGRGWWRR